MSNIDKRALRHSAESIICILENIAGFEPSDIDGDSVELRFETEDGFDTGCDVSIVDQCQKTADVVRALLDELERNQQYIKRRDQENEDIALTVGKLRVELEAAKSKLNEQREYYEGVISDGSKRIAELEKSEEQLINERDHAEAALADMYFAATGDRPEWSNWFGFSDAVDAVVDRIADLEAKQPSPVVPEEKPMPNALSMLEREITQLIGDAQEATVTGYELIAEAWRLMDGQDPKTSDWHSKASKYLNSNIVEKVDDDRIEAVKAVLRRLAGNYPVTPGRLPGGFTIEDAKELHENLVRSHISQALSGEKMKKKDRDADLRWIHGVIVQAAWFVKASLEQTALSGTPPVTTDSWISCSDRMPEDTKMLLAFSQGEIVAAYWNWVVNPIDYKKYRAFTYLSGNILDDVTHWMSLPEPPQEVKP